MYAVKNKQTAKEEALSAPKKGKAVRKRIKAGGGAPIVAITATAFPRCTATDRCPR